MAPNNLPLTKIENSVVLRKRLGGEEGKGLVKKEILYDGYYYDVTDWVKVHPGGDIIDFYTEEGEDATAAIGQFHHRSIKKVELILKSFKRRAVDVTNYVDQVNLNPERLKRHHDLTHDFTKLYHELVQEGIFDPSPSHVILRMSECLLLALVGTLLTIFYSESLTCQIVGTFVLGVLAARCGFLMHEGGHNSLTGVPQLDKFVQAFAFGFGNGMSASFFTYHHQRHHSMPQTLHKDSDLETLPLLAFNKKCIEKHPKWARGFLIQNQAVLFMAIDALLVALYWKLYLHPKYAFKNGQYHELFFMGIHTIFAYHIGLWPYLGAAWLGASCMLGHISLAHLHFPLTQGPLHWVEYSLMHTTNIDPSWWADYIMGYLNHQVEHHLFPTMPQYKNILVRERVKALAKKYDMTYHSCSYWQAIKNCYHNLDHVAHEMRNT